MSTVEETSELKAGHPPAVKVGGMRITQNKPPKQEGEPEEVEVEDELSEEQQVAERQQPGAIYVSGFEAKGNKDFPPEAVKQYHEKPMPTHDKRPAHAQVKQINQPRQNNF